MKEYIERSAILDTLADPFRKASDETEVEILKCWDRIKKIPTADVVEVRHGRWIIDKETGDCYCSVCNQGAGCIWYNYCYDCGAKMDGGVNDAAD